MSKVITPDYVTKDFRLCWKRRDGNGGWGSSTFEKVTEERMQSIVKMFNDVQPEFEHWSEESENV